MDSNKLVLIGACLLFVLSIFLKVLFDKKEEDGQPGNSFVARLPIIAFVLIILSVFWVYYNTHQKVQQDIEKSAVQLNTIDSLVQQTGPALSEKIDIDSSSSASPEVPVSADTIEINKAIRKIQATNQQIDEMVNQTKGRQVLVGDLSTEIANLNAKKQSAMEQQLALKAKLAKARLVDICVFYFEERGDTSYNTAVQVAKLIDALGKYNVRIKKIARKVNEQKDYDIHRNEIRYNIYKDEKDETGIAHDLKALIDGSKLTKPVVLQDVKYQTPWYVSVFIY